MLSYLGVETLNETTVQGLLLFACLTQKESDLNLVIKGIEFQVKNDSSRKGCLKIDFMLDIDGVAVILEFKFHHKNGIEDPIKFILQRNYQENIELNDVISTNIFLDIAFKKRELS